MSDQPTVLLITCDHWPAYLLGEAGHPHIITPSLDELARSGTRYRNTYSECPVCIPARRTLMTGTTPRFHGDRVYKDHLEMPAVPTLAQAFRDQGYQAFAAGKLHVYPQRDRIGFDDVMLDEEGRLQYGALDDYELFLGERGFVGKQFAHGMGNNQYSTRPWHLPEETHVTNWVSSELARMIKRRNPKRPGFFYASFRHPHPPLTPLAPYLEMYRDLNPDLPHKGNWAQHDEHFPICLKRSRKEGRYMSEQAVRAALKAFYALCTHIDHQIRYLIGTLREEGLLDNTIICFTSDHGDMLGRHGLWGKRLFYEESAGVPMILLGPQGDERVGQKRVDDRLVGLQDVMPTLLDLAGLEIPESVQGLSMVGERKREYLFGEIGEGAGSTRMIHDGRHKLIYYAVGNVVQLFDLQADPEERQDLADDPGCAQIRASLTQQLIGELNGGDEQWAQGGQLIGLPAQEFKESSNRGLSGQRGTHWPPTLGWKG